MAQNLYPSSNSSSTSIWPATVSGGEINLREEFYDFLYGSTNEVAKGRPLILRKMNVDDNGEYTVCPCVDEKTGEPDKDSPCPYCWSEGKIWTEQWITGYKVVTGRGTTLAKLNSRYKPGKEGVDSIMFYLEYNTNPGKYDKIIEVELDEEGDIVIPYKRVSSYAINLPEAFRSDNGRIEYWRIAVVEEVPKASWDI